MNSRTKSNPLYKDAAFWLSIVAILFSALSYWNSERALEFNKESYNLAMNDSIYVDGEWSGDKIYIGNIVESRRFPEIESNPIFEGVEAYLKLKVTNTSQHPINIEKLRVDYDIGPGAMSIPWGATFKVPDSNANTTFPIFLNVRETAWMVTRVPLPLEKGVADALIRLPADSVYSSEDVMAEVVLRSAEKGRSDSVAFRIDETLRDTVIARMRSYGLSGNVLRHLPEMLVMGAPPLSLPSGCRAIRGQRVLMVDVTLSSGSSICKRLDYIDINRTPSEFGAEPAKE